MKEVKDLFDAKFTYDSDTPEECGDCGYFVNYTFELDGYKHNIYYDCTDCYREVDKGYEVTQILEDGTHIVDHYELVFSGTTKYKVDPETHEIKSLNTKANIERDEATYIHNLLILLHTELRSKYPNKERKYAHESGYKTEKTVSKLLADYINNAEDDPEPEKQAGSSFGGINL